MTHKYKDKCIYLECFCTIDGPAVIAMGARAVALWCALLLLACARAPVHAYTVDCNHEYTDCDTELSKLTSDDEDIPSPRTSSAITESLTEVETTSTVPPTRSTPKTIETTTLNKTDEIIPHVTESVVKPKPRLLNLSVDELQSFANALHNQTKSLEKNTRKVIDLSDVNLDDDDEDLPRIGVETKQKIPDKFYSNLQAPFHSILPDRGSEEIETCKENEINYKIGEHIDRGCEETCECAPGGAFECSPRCKHPYVRRGRRLNDPLCFESPVDDCCSIIACATGNGDAKVSKLEVCRYGNDTHAVGTKWQIGCEQTCVCEPNSVVTCKPRCKPLIPSEKCINVQDPNDACCEVQVCDVSQDVHEEPAENVTSSTLTSSTTSEPMKAFEDYDDSPKFPMRPLVLTEPIGSIKVLHNNSVQVNLMHVNNTKDPIHLQLSDDGGKTFKDVELQYSNLILNLKGGNDYILKTKETGTKFNFTITSSDTGANELPNDNLLNVTKVGCYHDGQYYSVGEEFRIGCTELCECTGPDMQECAALVCPNHVGLELMSKGCVRWAPNPPPQPPNCCPRTARCLSDGTCHYNGVAVPNWSEVPISLTGCEQRCFCENGELDCQEVCSPLPPIPPQTLRCPPLHRPAPVNISDEDCCKHWGCLPNVGTPQDLPSRPLHPKQPPFLPTIPPEMYPQEDIPDYDQNNIHRPINSLEPSLPGLPPGLTIPPNYGDDNKKLSVLSLVADSPTSVKMLFGLPPVLVGLRGSVDLRYTDKSKYEASLVLIPPPRSVTELHDPGRVEFTTSPYADPYNWSVVVEARAVGSEAAELTWRGIPSPAERWVRVYRAAHACGPPGVGTRREHDAFRLAARDLPPSITLTGLEPNTRCRVWLELFLTNGKVKTSNVLEINTKSQDSPEPIDNEIEASSIAGSRGAPRGDYYGALVVVGVVAALGALTSLLLLLVVVRRHRPRSVPITPVPTAPRESSLPPYDNPAYKLELQQETMDL
ncbi:hypothetical protein K1T71_010914 [Dendrolimus kikuchii]|uniref:Uncharacterized protein n=1 Tax=Dendrolimus kikuchii TaxID=765133 RepID=A0ACC1CQ70_9NEOP|nr:hypothetical protein K1T71_010914 [Dendrolimus kikuchii]